MPLVIPLLRSLLACSCIAIISMAIGCRGGWSRNDAPATFANAESANPALNSVDQTPQALTVSATSPSSNEARQAQEAALVDIVAELSDTGALDEESKAQLLADLQEAKPENWPLIVKQFRSVLAYRKQLAAREEQPESAGFAQSTTPRPDEAKAEPSTRRSEPAQRIARQSVSPSEPLDESRERPKVATQAVTTAAVRELPTEHMAAAAHADLATPVILSKPPARPAQQVSYAALPAKNQDWQSHVQQAVVGLQAQVQPVPGSPDEVNEHMRLRLLQLLAGDQDGAMGPIPGATAPQQDYWSQQLFAVSTYLDSDRQPDNKRRAAGSLTHLDLARAKLAELATLQVRSLAFVKSVDGYGAYEVLEDSTFRPDQEVTLYAEIDNFSSESTKDGQLTRLSTSYEIVDGKGKRVDSAQFPEVEDVCKTKRRDFHMQYTIPLPTRIYPDEYQLRLIVTDQQSHKIGQAILPFEIAE